MNPEELEKLKQSLTSESGITSGQFRWMQWILGGLVFVAVISFVTLTISYFTGSQSSYLNLGNVVNQQNTAIQVLSAKIDMLTNEISQLNQQGKISTSTR